MPLEVDKYTLIDEETILFEYEGTVTKQVLLDTLSEIEHILDAIEVDRKKKRKMVNIAIETLQNLQLHAYPASDTDYNFFPLFLISTNDNHVSITIGNLVATEERAILNDKITKINSLNAEEVKFLYGVIMKQTVVKFSSKGGAGLGLIDMKKKSGNDLRFTFQDVDDKVCYFSLKVTVDR